MICLQIPCGHGACGLETTERSRVEIRRDGGKPREICEEGGDCGEDTECDAGGGGVRGA
jgi:hypothetical protein